MRRNVFAITGRGKGGSLEAFRSLPGLEVAVVKVLHHESKLGCPLTPSEKDS